MIAGTSVISITANCVLHSQAWSSSSFVQSYQPQKCSKYELVIFLISIQTSDMPSILSIVMEPTFPLHEPPTCNCGHRANPQTVNSQNPHGHVSRRYYHCDDICHGGQSKFVSWNDYQGIVEGNPRCVCGFTTRIGINNHNRQQWFHCPVGRCRFNEDVPAGYGASWRDGAAGPPGHGSYAAQAKPGIEISMTSYEVQLGHGREEIRGSCCGCVVM